VGSLDSTSSNNSSASNNLEELRKRFIVDESEYDKQFLERHLEMTLNYAVITSDGKVIIKSEDIIEKDKVGLIILTRFLGNKLNNEIKETITNNEISEYSRIDEKNVNAYLTKLTKSRDVLRVSKGIYKMNPSKINEFLSSLGK